MKKRFLSVLLAIAFSVSFISSPVYASDIICIDEDSIFVDDEYVYEVPQDGDSGDLIVVGDGDDYDAGDDYIEFEEDSDYQDIEVTVDDSFGYDSLEEEAGDEESEVTILEEADDAEATENASNPGDSEDDAVVDASNGASDDDSDDLPEGTYKITYILNGGENSPENPGTYTKGDPKITLKPASKKGYTFAGWYKDDKLKKKTASIPKGSTGDKVFYAKYKAIKYTVKFKKNGATGGSMAAKKYTYDKAGNLPKCKFTRKGYSFAGWVADKDSTEIIFANEAEILNYFDEKGKTLTLYAKWTENIYTVTYNMPEGAENDPENITTFKVTDPTFTLKAPTYNNYLFKGWYKDQKYKTKITKIKKGSAKDLQLYAKFITNKFTITYNTNGGVNDPDNPESYSRETETIRLKAPTRQYYTFNGWYKDKKFTTRITSIKQGSSGDLELYAKWTPYKYTISFNGNNANSGKMADMKKCKSDETYTLTANAFVRNGYNFTGWNTEADGSGTAYADGEEVINLADEDGKEIVMYAQWQIIEYSISYMLNGGTNDPSNPFMYTVESENITLADASKPPYAFGGWFADENFSERVTSIPKGSTGDMVLYARWVKSIRAEDYGATPNDASDDSDAINDAINAAAQMAEDEGITVAVTLGSGTFNLGIEGEWGTYAINMKTGVSLEMKEDTILKLVTSSVTQDSGIILLQCVDNCSVSGGKLVGSTTKLKYDVYGIWVKGCKNISISNMDISNCECDGIYLAVQQFQGYNNMGNDGVYITGCTIHDNSRNNIGLIDADNVKIKNCNIFNTGERQPCCGICIEPNFDDMSGDKVCKNIYIEDTTINTCRDKNDWHYRTFYTYNNKEDGRPVCNGVYIKHCKFTGYFGNYSGKNVYVSNDTVIDGTAEGLVRKD